MKHSSTRPAIFAKRFWVLGFAALVILSLLARDRGETAFINGQVLTFDLAVPTASAVLVRNGRIALIGDDKAVLKAASDSASVQDLEGRVLAPGFVDAHSHFPVSGLSAVSVNVAPPPIGPGHSKQAVLDAIQAAILARGSNQTDGFVLGFNYDNTAFDIPEHPTRDDLDAISGGVPVYLWHSSGHLGVANSAALERLGISESDPPVEGGERRRDEAGRLTGLLLEHAAPSLTTLLDQLSWRQQWRIVTAARDEYLSYGVTTVQNGFASLAMHRALKFLHHVGVLPQGVHTWIADDKLSDAQRQSIKPESTIKIIVDGSPQGLTAYLTEPYLVDAFGPENRGIPIFEQSDLNDLVHSYHKRGHQIAMHGNGDAAIDQIIEAVRFSNELSPRLDARHILVHAQILRPDQITQMAALGLQPSFFTAHTFYWGDWHRQTLGVKRASGLSPAVSAMKLGLRMSLHSDTPVTPIDPIGIMWSATTRETRSGFVLGEGERVSRLAALKGVTIDAAWQSFLDAEIGSIAVGKQADLVVLSDNPLTVDDLRSVVVDETWIGGKRRYLKP